MILTISGPSGVGKNTIARELSKYLNWRETISCTTRDRRAIEKDGIDYYFLSRNEFQERVEKKEFIEYEVFNNNYYGTLIKELNYDNVISILQVEGVRQIKANVKHDNVYSILLLPPSEIELEDRLKKRYSLKPDSKELASRLEISTQEIVTFFKSQELFDCRLINGDLEIAFKYLLTLIKN